MECRPIENVVLVRLHRFEGTQQVLNAGRLGEALIGCSYVPTIAAGGRRSCLRIPLGLLQAQDGGSIADDVDAGDLVGLEAQQVRIAQFVHGPYLGCEWVGWAGAEEDV